ncbi:MAG: hypothetical protein APR56_07430 [Methanosaeta sp. SDB]|nr:MAG: hypothetical protein APR56_07430 [Methanosaeta sp. SDB]
MKMVIIVYNGALDREVGKITAAAGVEGYTKWVEVYGRGRTSDPHLGTHVWPKVNYLMLICVEDEQARKLLEGIRELRKRLGREGVKAFMLPCEDVT